MHALTLSLLICLTINTAAFVPAYVQQTDRLTDICYALTFVAVACYGVWQKGISLPKLTLLAMICLWALRLGTFLFIRIHETGVDRRFDDIRNNLLYSGAFWLLQGVTVWIVMLPSTLFFANRVKRICPLAYIAVALWLVGLIIETVADQQKYRFITDPGNSGKWIDSGLWRYSRHPNYFGEILVWTGIYGYTLFGLNTTQSLVGLISPAFISLLLIFVSGVPPLEKKADQRWGNNPQYQSYKAKTNLLIPWPPKKNNNNTSTR
ncbi:MAG: DUF1295 domain-containing protein [Myxococcota bacterium]